MTRARHRVLLVGPWRSSAAGGCCGGDAAGLSEQHDDRCAAERAEAHLAAAVVRALRDEVDEGVDVQLVDPRNTVFLLPAVYRDARRAALRPRRALAEAVRATTPWALVVDGRVVSLAVELTPAEAIRCTMER